VPDPPCYLRYNKRLLALFGSEAGRRSKAPQTVLGERPSFERLL
jgi:hypothetical protein